MFTGAGAHLLALRLLSRDVGRLLSRLARQRLLQDAQVKLPAVHVCDLRCLCSCMHARLVLFYCPEKL